MPRLGVPRSGFTGWPRNTFRAKQHDHHVLPAHGALHKRSALVGAVASAEVYPQTSDFTAWSDTKQASVPCYEDSLLRHQLEQSSRRKHCKAGEALSALNGITALLVSHISSTCLNLFCVRPQERSPRNSKRRLDEACLEQSPSTARNVVQSWIVQGKVLVNGKVVSKPGTPVSSQAKIDILAVEQQYVCR